MNYQQLNSKNELSSESTDCKSQVDVQKLIGLQILSKIISLLHNKFAVFTARGQWRVSENH